MTEYTPGPWTWMYRDNGQGSESTSLEGPEEKLIIFPTGWHSTGDFHPDNEEANARLISAAPELLEEAQKAADELCPPRRHKAAQENQTRATIHSATCKARGLFAAIAKATQP